MADHLDRYKIGAAPTDSELYPETDGKPMAASDIHRDRLTRTIDTLSAHFADQPAVYVSGDIMMYDIEGPERTAISPDVLVSYGLGKKSRLTYKVWEEGKVPDFVMEFSSKGTYRNDLDYKMRHYAKMGIPDYFLYDAEARYLPTPIMGFRLVDGEYQAIRPDAGYQVMPPDVEGGILSDVLRLAFYALGGELGIYDVVEEKWLQHPTDAEKARADAAEDRADEEAERAEQEVERAEQEAAARQEAEDRADEEAAARQEAEARADAATLRAEQEAAARQELEAELARLRQQYEPGKENT